MPKPPAKPLTFEDVLAQVSTHADRYAREFREEWPRTQRLLEDDEVREVNVIVSRIDNGAGVTLGNLEYLRQHRCAKLTWSVAIKWSVGQPRFQAIAKLVWDRAPGSRNASDIAELATKWGEMGASEQSAINTILDILATKSRQLIPGEKDIIIDFAGEEFYANRP